ncbi:hypothetical protein [Campylobacter helveticus]|uniref:hypothetical protein n=1 Tax=Campylobacter helveticus TaxID=28898 RepID=UPI0022EB0738|nr:hypothetical protein [Campylobacter helveticus]
MTKTITPKEKAKTIKSKNETSNAKKSLKEEVVKEETKETSKLTLKSLHKELSSLQDTMKNLKDDTLVNAHHLYHLKQSNTKNITELTNNLQDLKEERAKVFQLVEELSKLVFTLQQEVKLLKEDNVFIIKEFSKEKALNAKKIQILASHIQSNEKKTFSFFKKSSILEELNTLENKKEQKHSFIFNED